MEEDNADENQELLEKLQLGFESIEKIEEEEEEANYFELGVTSSFLKDVTPRKELNEEFDDVEEEIEAKSLVAKLQTISKIRDWFRLPRLKDKPTTKEDEKEKVEGQEEKKVEGKEEEESHIFQSMERLMTLIQDCNEAVSNVRVATLKSEAIRLRKVREMRNALLNELEAENKIAKMKYDKINKNWVKLKTLNDPLDIHNATNQQRDKCVALLERKDAVIEKLKKIIKRADYLFFEDLREQENKINILIDRIDEQLRVIADAYRKELELIENVNAKEKEDRLVANREKWDKFIEEKNEIENEIVEQRFKLMEEHEEKLDNFILECQESIREMTVEYFQKIRELNMQVDQMRGICDINAQKLKYNYNLLQKREEENRIAKKRMLHQLSDLKETLDKLKTETQNENKCLDAKLNKLKNELKFYGKEITILDKKADSVAQANNKKYFQLWDYNQKIVNDLINKILEVEKLFYEQQLCIPWKGPEYKSFSKESLPSYVRAISTISLETSHNAPEREKKLKLYKKAIQEELSPEEAERRKKLMKIIFEKIADKSGFLRDDNLETFLAAIPEEDKTLIRIDQVLKALGIKSEEDMLMLTRYLMPYLFCKICDLKVGKDPAYFLQLDTKYKDNLSDMASLGEEDRDILSEMTLAYISRFQASCEVVYKEFCNLENKKMDNLPIEFKPGEEAKSRIPTLSETKHFNFDDKLMLGAYDLKKKHQLLGVGTLLDKKPPEQFITTDELCKNFIIEQPPSTPEVLPTDNEIISCKTHSHELVMPTIHVIKALKNFMVDFHNVRKEVRQNYVDFVINKKRHTVSRLIDNKEVEEFWNRYKTFFGAEQLEMWNTFQLAMVNYIEDLRKRHALSEEVKKIKKTNLELRRLLLRYLEPRRNISVFESIVEKVEEAMGASTNDS